jgi:putative ABC transport system permease protein
LTKNFLLLVVIALIIAVPIAYYLMEKWLQAYPNRSEISWSTFIIAGVSAIGIALLTVSYHAIKSALVNPVKNLKGE